MNAAITRAIGTVKLFTKEHSPEILMISGAVGVVVTVVSACKATLKFQEVLEEHNEKMAKYKELEEKRAAGEVPEERYSNKDAKHDRMVMYVELLVEAIKCYGPAVLLGVSSVGCFGAATGIMKKRYISMASAYMMLQKDKEHLESRVIEEFGEEKLSELKGASKDEQVVITEIDENNNQKQYVDAPNYTAYAKFFDESNANFEKDPESNRIFLQAKQNYFNHRLIHRGHVFLNEVYEALGIEPTQAGQVMGWKYYKDPAEAKKHGASNYISFGIFDDKSAATRRFVNGLERSILLDFNVDKQPILGNVGLATA